MDFFLEKKKKMGKIYNELLFDLKDSLELPLEKTNYAENIYWVYGLVLRDHLPFNADEMIKKLAREGIGARSFFWCIHEQPAFLKTGLFSQEKYPVSGNVRANINHTCCKYSNRWNWNMDNNQRNWRKFRKCKFTDFYFQWNCRKCIHTSVDHYKWCLCFL